MRPDKLQSDFQKAVLVHDHGRWDEAEKLYRRILGRDDRHFGALCRLGLLRLRLSRFGEAERLFHRALKVDSRSADAHQLLGFALTGLARFDEAIRSYEQALAIRPAFAEACNNLGYALQVQGRLDEAISRYKEAIAIRPHYHEAHNNLGNTLHLLDRSDEAIVCYAKALHINPGYAEAHWNLATALRAVGRLEDAVASYEKAIAIRPDYQEAYNSLGNTLRALGRLEHAVAHYRKAIALNRAYIEAWINLGDALARLRQDEAALEAFASALALKANDPDILAKRGTVLVRLRREEEALACFDAALAAAPGHDLAFDGRANCVLAICDWQRASALWSGVPARVANGHLCNPLTFLGYSSDAALQLACAKRFIRSEVPVSPPPLWSGETWRNARIKVAYVATGFHRHPTGYLTAELIELHDRSRFEVIGVSLGPDDKSDVRARLIRAFDQFHDVRDKSDREIAALLNAWHIDIAVDRSGYTANARPGIFAARPTPIQVNYIGFPGTLGADFYDYILADSTVLPSDQQPFYAERIVHLPQSYLVTDSNPAVAPHVPTRAEAGLPERGFVFCCFNNCHKITPPVFDVWMRLLAAVDGSVLWLFRDREMAEANLRREAFARGIDPARLIFAHRIPFPDHMARHKLADLFLDTLPYNAHTTAADALWMGVPIVTCRGRSFAGRVAASLLQAIGMDDLVTDDIESYARLALRIALEPALVAQLRDRLRRNRVTHPLFNTDRYRRQIEAAYRRMWQNWQRGEPPGNFSIEPEENDPRHRH
jgi:protein O-GlcNAc transferase